MTNKEKLEEAIKALDAGDYMKAASLAYSVSISLTKKALGGIGSSDYWSDDGK